MRRWPNAAPVNVSIVRTPTPPGCSPGSTWTTADITLGGGTKAERWTVKAIVGNKIVPWLGDWYLARTGYASQQTDEPRDPASPDNLWRPVAGDHGAHGRFGARARRWSGQFWLTTHRGWLAAAAALGVVAWTALAAGRRGA